MNKEKMNEEDSIEQKRAPSNVNTWQNAFETLLVHLLVSCGVVPLCVIRSRVFFFSQPLNIQAARGNLEPYNWVSALT